MFSSIISKTVKELRDNVMATEETWRKLRAEGIPGEANEISDYLNTEKAVYASAIAKANSEAIDELSGNLKAAYTKFKNLRKIILPENADIAAESVILLSDPILTRTMLEKAEAHMDEIRTHLMNMKDLVYPKYKLSDARKQECADSLKFMEELIANENYGFGDESKIDCKSKVTSNGNILASSDKLRIYGRDFASKHEKNSTSMTAWASLLSNLKPTSEYTKLSISERDAYNRAIKVMEKVADICSTYTKTVTSCIESLCDSFDHMSERLK